MEQAISYETASVSQKRGLSGSTLKLIAIITMFIDHAGAGIVGRIMSAQGIVYPPRTQNLHRPIGFCAGFLCSFDVNCLLHCTLC